MIETEVAVVGGGPAGVAAAITLARGGRQVTLFDKAEFPRDKICGDALTTAALRLLQGLGLEPSAVESWRATDSVRVRAPSGRERRFELPGNQGTFVAAARRNDLDAALIDLAISNSVTVCQGAAIEETTVNGRTSGVELTVAGVGQVKAASVIAADGMWSPVRKQLGLAVADYRGDAHAFRQYFTGVSEQAAGELYVTFEEDLLPGYFWSFPLADGGANVGFGIHRGHGYTVRQMAQVWPDLLRRHHIKVLLGPNARPEGPHRAWPIPARIGRLPLAAAGGRVLFVGDAAGAVDAMSGEGIGQALQTGIWAAEALIDAPDDPVAAETRYRSKVSHDLSPDDRMSRWLVSLLSRPKGAEAAVRIAGMSSWTRTNFVRWLFEDEPRGALLTPSRWRRNFLRRPGAY